MKKPSSAESKRHTQSLIQHIQRSRKERTIFLSDIEHSTRFWSRHGDIQGRLMVDRHNWLLFPIIRHFRGRIVKTIGDSILAAFKHPDQALQAAMASQQILERERKINPDFDIKIRIGLHSGAALVEHNDVYGDVVNVASRLESRGKGNEILVSAETRNRLKQEYPLVDKGAFVPKGTSEPLAVYHCLWRQTPDQLARIRLPSRLPLVRRQRLEMLFYAVATVAAAGVLVRLYLRFILSENETLSLVLLDPGLFWWEYPLLILAGLGLLAGVYYALFKLKGIPLPALKVAKGGFCFLAAFLLAWGVLSWLPGQAGRYVHTALFASQHLFVTSLVADNPVYSAPALDAPPLKTSQPGQLLLLADVKKSGPLVWNKVLIGPGRYGWIPRVLPPEVGVPARRLTLTDKFYFRILDVYALVVGLAGFVWGFFTFRVRPA